MFLTAASLSGLARAAEVVVVKSKDLALYDKAIAGFQEIYRGNPKILTMKKGEDPRQLAETVRKEKPRVILAVGLGAAKVLKNEISEVPIVFCMAMHPIQNNLKSKHTTGVELDPLPLEQMEMFKRVIPGLKRIGLIYDPKRTGRFVERTRRSARELGLQLVARQVKAREEVLGAFHEILKKADALWLIRDATVLSREFFDYLLIVQVEQKFPLLAYSSQFVKKGALCSFSTTYKNQGKRAAELVLSILAGISPAEIPIQAPEGVLTINKNSAAKTHVKVPASVYRLPGVTVVQ